jgi:hypothetical protein
VIEGDEDGCTKLNGLGGIIVCLDGEGSPTNSRSLFKDGDVDGQAFLLSVLL